MANPKKIIVKVFVHGIFYKDIITEIEKQFVTIYISTHINSRSKQMKKQFHAVIIFDSINNYSAYFNDTDIRWEEKEIVFYPSTENYINS